MKKKIPIVAIVGRTNVGKSSLYNAILKKREAIVAREPGTTRDSLMALADYKGYQFYLLDTAGVKNPEDEFEATIQDQVNQAAILADVILIVTEADVPITDQDRKIVDIALRTNKPTYLVINKIDRLKHRANVPRHINKVGVKEFIPVSATQLKGIDDLLEKLISNIPKIKGYEDKGEIKLAIIGRPNVGKSSLFNSLARKQQALVADRAGTTRDLNHTTIKYEGKTIELIDSAGIRRPGKINVGVEKFSVMRAISAIDQADICLLLIDCNELSVQLDQKLAGTITEAGKGLIIVVSKWDIYKEGLDKGREMVTKQIAADLEFVAWAPLIFTSAVTGQNVTKIFDLALDIMEQRSKKISTHELNDWLKKVTASHPPAGIKGQFPKLNYMVQESDNSLPSFKIFGSQTKFTHFSYRRYLEHRLREDYGFEGTPVQIWLIDKMAKRDNGNV